MVGLFVSPFIRYSRVVMISIFITDAPNRTNGIASGLLEKSAPVRNGKVIQPIAAPKTNLDASAPFI